jgi:hypothetical protein
MAHPIPEAVFFGIAVDLARTMGAECLAKRSHNSHTANRNILAGLAARIFATGDGFQ